MSATLGDSQKSDNAQQPVSMKVMRLRKPEFSCQLPVVFEGGDLFGDKPNCYISVHTSPAFKRNPQQFLQAQREVAKQQLLSQPDVEVNEPLQLDSLGFVDRWILPGSFGKIFVGEVFTGYLSLHNSSYNPVKSVSIKVCVNLAASQSVNMNS